MTDSSISVTWKSAVVLRADRSQRSRHGIRGSVKDSALCALRQKGSPPGPGDGSKPSPVTVGGSAGRTLIETARHAGPGRRPYRSR